MTVCISITATSCRILSSVRRLVSRWAALEEAGDILARMGQVFANFSL
jgi:hypothetical protein